MVYFNALLIAAALPFALSATTSISDDNDCPGVFFVNDQARDGACCVGGSLSLYLSTCAGWPICSGPATTSTTSTPLSCATVIPSDSDYASHISEAKSSLSASGTNIVTTINPGDSIAASTGPSATQTSAAPSATQTSNTNAAMRFHGSGFDMVCGGLGMVVAVGLGGAALWL